MRFVYILKHPITGEIRYVGCTTDPEKRLRSHISCCRNRSYEKEIWIADLLDKGLRPVMEVIECTDQPGARERFWILHYRRAGALLLNRNDGPPAPVTLSTETLAKMSRSAKNRVDDAFRSRMSDTMRATMSDPAKRQIAIDAATRAM